MYKNSKLIRKHHIKEENYQELFQYLRMLPVSHKGFEPHLRVKLTGHYARGLTILTKPHHANEKCWFINKGMIIAIYYDIKKRLVPYAIFKKGEIGILADNFVNQKNAPPFLVACPGSHLLEITHKDMKEIYIRFPESMLLQSMILASHMEKDRMKDEMLQLPGKPRVKEFYKWLPELKGRKPVTKFPKKFQSSFLRLTPGSFSRILKEIEAEEG